MIALTKYTVQLSSLMRSEVEINGSLGNVHCNSSILISSLRKIVKQPDKHQKLTEANEAVKLLRAMFERGEATAKSDPKSMYESNPFL